MPIVARGEAIGALAVYFQQERPEPSAEDAELIRSFAHQAGVALERARAYEVEHEAAMTLQRNLMPEGTGYAANVDVDGRYLPATRGVHVGGDWYDIVDRPDGTVAFAVGDIAGHGLQAAAAMGQVRSAWRALALSMTEPNAILASLDRFATGVDGAFFSTILTMLLDPSRNELRYASAGHPPALVIEPGGSTRFLEGGRSVPLGLPFDLPRPQANERLVPGSILVVYTDGLVERREEPLDRGLERLAQVASRVRAGSLTEISDALLELVADDRHDDVALLTIGPRRPAEVFRRTFPADAHELATMRAELRAWLERSGSPVGDPGGRRARVYRGGDQRDRARVHRPRRRRADRGGIRGGEAPGLGDRSRPVASPPPGRLAGPGSRPGPGGHRRHRRRARRGRHHGPDAGRDPVSSTELATIAFEDAERATVATIRGEVDLSNADRLLDELMARVGAAPWLVVDLSGCSYLDSAGLRVIARVDVRCRDVGSGLRLVVDRGGSIDRVLAMTHMDEVLTVDRLLDDALVSALEDVDGERPERPGDRRGSGRALARASVGAGAFEALGRAGAQQLGVARRADEAEPAPRHLDRPLDRWARGCPGRRPARRRRPRPGRARRASRATRGRRSPRTRA